MSLERFRGGDTELPSLPAAGDVILIRKCFALVAPFCLTSLVLLQVKLKHGSVAQHFLLLPMLPPTFQRGGACSSSELFDSQYLAVLKAGALALGLKVLPCRCVTAEAVTYPPVILSSRSSCKLLDNSNPCPSRECWEMYKISSLTYLPCSTSQGSVNSQQL